MRIIIDVRMKIDKESITAHKFYKEVSKNYSSHEKIGHQVYKHKLFSR